MEKLKCIGLTFVVWLVFAALAYIFRFLLVYAWAVFTYCTGGFIGIVFGDDSLWDAMLSLNEYNLWYGYLTISGAIALKIIYDDITSPNSRNDLEKLRSQKIYIKDLRQNRSGNNQNHRKLKEIFTSTQINEFNNFCNTIEQKLQRKYDAKVLTSDNANEIMRSEIKGWLKKRKINKRDTEDILFELRLL